MSKRHCTECDTLRDALEDMCWQFAHRVVTVNGQPALSDGGLSALEHAFAVLGWKEAHVVDGDVSCEVEGCVEWGTCGGFWGDLYLRMCGVHAGRAGRGDPRPEVRQQALDRDTDRRTP